MHDIACWSMEISRVYFILGILIFKNNVILPSQDFALLKIKFDHNTKLKKFDILKLFVLKKQEMMITKNLMHFKAFDMDFGV